MGRVVVVGRCCIELGVMLLLGWEIGEAEVLDKM